MVHNSHFYPASTVIDRAKSVPGVVDSVVFHGVNRTKIDGLIKEVSGIYTSSNLDELVRNSHFACQHMEVGISE